MHFEGDRVPRLHLCVIALLDFDLATAAQVSKFPDPPVLVLVALLLIVFNGDTVCYFFRRVRRVSESFRGVASHGVFKFWWLS